MRPAWFRFLKSTAPVSTPLVTYAFVMKRGRKTSISTIQRTLSNPFYYGLIVWNGETYEGTHKPLITKTLFDRCRAVMEQRGREVKKHEPERHPFRQLLTCDYCGCSITSSIAKGKYVYYHCGKRKGKCPGKYVPEQAIDEEIRSALQTVSLAPADAEKIEQHLQELHAKDVQAGASPHRNAPQRSENLRRKTGTPFLICPSPATSPARSTSPRNRNSSPRRPASGKNCGASRAEVIRGLNSPFPY